MGEGQAEMVSLGHTGEGQQTEGPRKKAEPQGCRAERNLVHMSERV